MALQPDGSDQRDGEMLASSILHREQFAEIVRVVGPLRAAELAAKLDGPIQDLLTSSARADVDALISGIHRLRGSASTLGMHALSLELERWELALAAGADGAAAVELVRRAHADAVKAVAEALAGEVSAHADGRTSR
jgi:HPt (histidine-containing phosphotransfer) domain-containing protein